MKIDQKDWKIMSILEKAVVIVDAAMHVFLVSRLGKYGLNGDEMLFGIYATATAAWYLSSSAAKQHLVREARTRDRSKRAAATSA